MTKRFFKEACIWGFVLWLIGYLMGIILFFIVPADMIGWLITPIGIVIMLWVLAKKIKGGSLRYYLQMAFVWTLLAIVLDYIFNVRLFNIGSSYYKADVYIYYAVTFLLPLVYGYKRAPRK